MSLCQPIQLEQSNSDANSRIVTINTLITRCACRNQYGTTKKKHRGNLLISYRYCSPTSIESNQSRYVLIYLSFSKHNMGRIEKRNESLWTVCDVEYKIQ